MKKNKLLAGLLAVSLLVGMAVPAFATGEADTVGAPEVEQGTTGGAEESGTGGTTEPETPAEIPEVNVKLDLRGPGTNNSGGKGHDFEFDYEKAYRTYMDMNNSKNNEITLTIKDAVIAALEDGVNNTVSNDADHTKQMNKAILADQDVANKIASVGIKITPIIEGQAPSHVKIYGKIMPLTINDGVGEPGTDTMAGYLIDYFTFADCDEGGANWRARAFAPEKEEYLIKGIKWLSSEADNADNVIGVTSEVVVRRRNRIDTASTDWNTGDADEYGKVVSYVNGKTTLQATNVETSALYYAPYTTFGRGKENYAFGNGFETSATFDVSGMVEGDQMYWETGLNGNASGATRSAVWTRLDKTAEGIKVTDGYINEGGTSTTAEREKVLFNGNGEIRITTTVEPFAGKVRFISSVGEVVDNGIGSQSTQTMFINGAPTAYGSARYGWVYFNKASKTVGVSGVAYRDLTAPEAATEAEKAELASRFAKATELASNLYASVDGKDVAPSKYWVEVKAGATDKAAAYKAAIDALNADIIAEAVKTGTKEEVNDFLKILADAKTALGEVKNGTKPAEAVAPTVGTANTTGTTAKAEATITPPENATAADDIAATLPETSTNAVITAAKTANKPAEIEVKLPANNDKGTVTSIKVPEAVFAAAASANAEQANAKKVIFEVKDNAGTNSQVKWEFDTGVAGVKAEDFAAVNLMATPKQDAKVVLDTTVTGLDTSAPAKADLVKFEHSGTIPAGTKVTVPTTVTVIGAAKAYAYSILSNGKVDLSSEVEVTINGTNAEFTPKHFSDILISANKITPVTVNPGPPPVGPVTRPSYSGGGSATPTTTPSTDLTTIIENTAISANTVKGTKVEVPSSISDPTFDSKEIALNAPEAKAFVDTAANSGFAFAKVFQMNLFDGKTKVTKVEDGKVKISIPFAGKAGYEYVVLRYETNGGITAMPALYKDGQITFTTNHFSLYAIAVKSTNKNLFADTTVKPGTPESGTTTVPQTSACTLTKLF